MLCYFRIRMVQKIFIRNFCCFTAFILELLLLQWLCLLWNSSKFANFFVRSSLGLHVQDYLSKFFWIIFTMMHHDWSVLFCIWVWSASLNIITRFPKMIKLLRNRSLFKYRMRWWWCSDELSKRWFIFYIWINLMILFKITRIAENNK